MLSIVLAGLAMAARDSVGTWLTIAEARGRPVLAGGLDAVGDLATIGVTVTGAGAVLDDIRAHHLSVHTVVLLAVMVLVSFFGTIVWTRLGRRITADPSLVATSSVQHPSVKP